MTKALSSDFNGLVEWIRDGDHILRNGEEFMLCEPHSIHFDISKIATGATSSWTATSRLSEDASENEGFQHLNWIKVAGSTDDRLSVFSLEGGLIHRFDFIEEITIYPETTAHGPVGGAYRATTTDRIFRDQQIPEGGYLKGEPGSLHYWDDDGDAKIYMTLFLDPERFAIMFNQVHGHEDIASGRLSVIAEMFESALQRRAREGHFDEFGMLISDDHRIGAHVPVRLENLTLQCGGATTSKQVSATASHGDLFESARSTLNDSFSVTKSTAVLLAVVFGIAVGAAFF